MTPQIKVEKTLSAPYRTKNQVVLSDWIDYNGHMNVAYYTLAFDKALDFFFEDVLNIGPSFVNKNLPILILSVRFLSIKPVKPGAPLKIESPNALKKPATGPCVDGSFPQLSPTSLKISGWLSLPS